MTIDEVRTLKSGDSLIHDHGHTGMVVSVRSWHAAIKWSCNKTAFDYVFDSSRELYWSWVHLVVPGWDGACPT